MGAVSKEVSQVSRRVEEEEEDDDEMEVEEEKEEDDETEVEEEESPPSSLTASFFIYLPMLSYVTSKYIFSVKI